MGRGPRAMRGMRGRIDAMRATIDGMETRIDGMARARHPGHDRRAMNIAVTLRVTSPGSTRKRPGLVTRSVTATIYRPAARRRARVGAAFRADADRADFGRAADAAPPIRPPFFAGARFGRLPTPDPPFLPPPVVAFTVAQARRSASSSGTPRSSYPSSMCSAIRFCLSVYLDLSPRGIGRLLHVQD